VFENYPDIVKPEQVMTMLGIGKSSVYALLKSGQIRHVRVGTKYIIPKHSVIAFATDLCYNDSMIINGRSVHQSVKGVST